MQSNLFDVEEIVPSISGLRYEEEFLDAAEEAHWLGVVRSLPLEKAKYKEYVARRRIISFGGSYDFNNLRLKAARDLDERLKPLRRKVAAWFGIADDDFTQVMVSEYAPGTPLGWHRDVPDFESIVGLSLGGTATLRFRRFPPEGAARRQLADLRVAPRSIYGIGGEARWSWQHSVPPVPALRWSVTFRTPRSTAPARSSSADASA